MPEFDERTIVKQCRKGDEEAFRQLVEHYKSLVFFLVRQSVTDPGRVEEVVQEAFVRIYRGLRYFRGRARLTTWIYRIVLNLRAEERRRKPVVFVSLDDASQTDQPRLQLGAADRAFADLELRDHVTKAMSQLSSEAEFVLTAHYIHGMQYQTLAEHLDVPLGTVKTKLHRAKRQLREILEHEMAVDSHDHLRRRSGDG